MKGLVWIMDLPRNRYLRNRRCTAILGVHVCLGRVIYRAGHSRVSHEICALPPDLAHMGFGNPDLCEFLFASLYP